MKAELRVTFDAADDSTTNTQRKGSNVIDGAEQTVTPPSLKERNSHPNTTHCVQCNKELKIVGLSNSIKYCLDCEA